MLGESKWHIFRPGHLIYKPRERGFAVIAIYSQPTAQWQHPCTVASVQVVASREDGDYWGLVWKRVDLITTVSSPQWASHGQSVGEIAEGMGNQALARQKLGICQTCWWQSNTKPTGVGLGLLMLSLNRFYLGATSSFSANVGSCEAAANESLQPGQACLVIALVRSFTPHFMGKVLHPPSRLPWTCCISVYIVIVSPLHLCS